MRKKIHLFLLVSLFLPVLGRGEDDITDNDLQIEALREWIATKRQVTVGERGGNLSLSGEVRFKYFTVNEKRNGIKNIGTNSRFPYIPDNDFGISFNSLFDYRADTTWASARIAFDNTMGIVGGTTGNISLDRAFLGFRGIEGDNSTFDVEVGRRRIGYTFDSKIQFGARMDGVLLKYDQSSDKIGDFYLYASPFVVNEVNNQFAYVAEMGLLNIADTGLYGKYSIIDWDTINTSVSPSARRYQFINNQFILGWKFPSLGKVTTFYSAFLVNAAAQATPILNNDIANLASYIGFSMGEVRKTGDWNFETFVQYVQPQAIPDFDFSGIGKGNADGIGLYTLNLSGSGGPTTNATAVGNSNYIGWQVQFLYAATDSLTISQVFRLSHSLDYLPTTYDYKRYTFELIYAW